MVSKHGKEVTARKVSKSRQATECPDLPAGDRRHRSDSGEPGLEPERFSRRVGQRILCRQPVIGGILSRLIAQTQEKLRNAEECLVWYQRERDRAAAELVELEQLLALEQNRIQEDSDSDPDKEGKTD